MSKYAGVIGGILCVLAMGTAGYAGNETAAAVPAPSGNVVDGVRVVGYTAAKFTFEPNPVVVKLGEKVRLIAETKDVTHGIAISGYNINQVVNPGRKAIIEFVASKEGEFDITCSVYCGAGHEGMRGKLIVTQ